MCLEPRCGKLPTQDFSDERKCFLLLEASGFHLLDGSGAGRLVSILAAAASCSEQGIGACGHRTQKSPPRDSETRYCRSDRCTMTHLPFVFMFSCVPSPFPSPALPTLSTSHFLQYNSLSSCHAISDGCRAGSLSYLRALASLYGSRLSFLYPQGTAKEACRVLLLSSPGPAGFLRCLLMHSCASPSPPHRVYASGVVTHSIRPVPPCPGMCLESGTDLK